MVTTTRRSFSGAVVLCVLILGGADSASPAARGANAVGRIDAGQRSRWAVPHHLTGKFAEHLGANIYGGMDAQILRNPTLADWPFATGRMSPDGVATFESDPDRIARELRRQAGRNGWPEADLKRLVDARADGLATWWMKEGDPVVVSPDVGPFGGRAQRLEIGRAGQGIAQWTPLPLARTRKYDVEIFARAIGIGELSVSLSGVGADTSAARARIVGVGTEWKKFTARLEVDATLPPEAPVRFALTAAQPGQLVVGRVLLRPADHIQGADPEVVAFLKDSRLPLLRWPGGNFVSGYHWREGVGPLEQRPTRPNYAWGGVEPNTFGTDEFIAFCRAVGCEPMICVNAGDGTPAEAAQWIEYCNGTTNTPMGAWRAANGHPEPYGVKHWEVGNELWGRWQFYWTTASGYVDRYRAFTPAMKAADRSIQLYACGAPVFWGKAWNDTLIRGLGAELRAITDHPLIGGDVSPSTDPLDVYRDFMAVPDVLETRWAGLRQDLLAAGVSEPSLAITELQLFAHIKGQTDASSRLTGRTLVNPGTLAEALYDVLIYHRALRLAPFVSMVTHSATVNHGGGLRKERERVYANPCHYAQAAFAAFAGATPVAVELTAGKEFAPRVLPELRRATPGCEYGVVDAVAALAGDGRLLVSLVHRGSEGPVDVDLAIEGFSPRPKALTHTLAADAPWAANTLEAPRAVTPKETEIDVSGGRLRLRLERFSFVRVDLFPSEPETDAP